MDSSTVDVASLPKFQRAAQFNPIDQTVSVNEIPVPTIKAHEILVKVKAATLCHSDLMLFEKNELNMKLEAAKSFTMGHEACGIIVAVGRDVQGFHVNDNICWLPTMNACFECEACQFNNVFCEEGTSVVQGFTIDGVFQEYVVIDWRNGARMPAGMDLTSFAPLSCAGVTSFNSVTDTIAELVGEPSQTWVAVIGCGGLGHLGVQYLKAYGYKVIGIDTSSEALEQVKRLGADHIFNSAEEADYLHRIRDITGKGCHAAINYTNSAHAYASMPNLLRYNGILNVAGIPQKPLQFSALEVSMKRFRIVGSSNGTTPGLRKCIEFSHKHGIRPHVTQYSLDQFPEMIELMMSNKHKGRLGVVFAW